MISRTRRRFFLSDASRSDLLFAVLQLVFLLLGTMLLTMGLPT